jgi:endonuclease YncB( thermonuclease family)
VSDGERFLFDLSMALRSLPRGTLRDLFKPRRPGDDLSERIVCDQILEHLERSGWRLEHHAKPTVAPAPMTRCAVLALLLALSLAAPAAADERLTGRARVTDGDTISVGGVAVRLKGVAAPEVAHFGDPGEPGGEAAKTFMVEMVDGQTVVCDLTQERTHGRRVDWCYRECQDIAEALIRAGLARDCPRFSGGRYAVAEQPEAVALPFPSYCVPR